MWGILLTGITVLFIQPNALNSEKNIDNYLWFLSKAQRQTAEDLNKYSEKIQLNDIEKSNSIFLTKQDESKKRIKEISYQIEFYVANHLECDFSRGKGKSIFITSIPYHFDGRTFSGAVVLNLFKTEAYSSNEFKNLFIHEWIHLQQENLSTRDDHKEEGLKILFYEGQALYGAHEIFPLVSIEEMLDWKSSLTKKDLDYFCKAEVNEKFFDDHRELLFSGNQNQLAKSRMGYWIGYQIFLNLHKNKIWCDVNFELFRSEYKRSLKNIKNKYCYQE